MRPLDRVRSKAQLARLVDEFNEKFPVGTQVMLRTDANGEITTTVRGAAIVLEGHSAIAWFVGVSGGYSIEGARVRLADPTQRSA